MLPVKFYRNYFIFPPNFEEADFPFFNFGCKNICLRIRREDTLYGSCIDLIFEQMFNNRISVVQQVPCSVSV